MFWGNNSPSSSENEGYNSGRPRGRDERLSPRRTPLSSRTKTSTTPMTSTLMTPSPLQSPLISDLYPSRSHNRDDSFSSTQRGYLADSTLTSPTKRRRKRSTRRSRLTDNLFLEDNLLIQSPLGMTSRYRSSVRQNLKRYSPQTSDTSPDTSPNSVRRRDSFSQSVRLSTDLSKIKISHTWFVKMTFLCMVVISIAGVFMLMDAAVPADQGYDLTSPEILYDFDRPTVHISDGGLRGKITSGHWEGMKHSKKKIHESTEKKEQEHDHHEKEMTKKHKGDPNEKTAKKSSTKNTHKRHKHNKFKLPKVQMPTFNLKHEHDFETIDKALYTGSSTHNRRVVMVDSSMPMPHHRKIDLYPADFTDNTQLYPILDSDDERLSRMEVRAPYSTDECVPMSDWQTTFHPSCNEMHDLSMPDLGEEDGFDFQLFGTKGFWRNAWKVESEEHETIVLKTLKYVHNFEDAHYEHDRVDAIAMERLTSSKHVINVFGFCGHSVMTEYADGTRVGELADKSKKKPLARLRIARDIASGLADVHGIDGDGDASFVHLDINPANVVSVGGTLKLNDFNIGIIRQRNITTNEPCGFPAQYPNPQWRSPEEARDEQHLTEKVDVFSMGHIFFRLICGHEPWNKLEPGGRPAKEEVNEKVKKGILPFIPDSVQDTNDPEVIAIRDAMLACYTFNPSERPKAREIAKRLDKTLQKLEQSMIS